MSLYELSQQEAFRGNLQRSLWVITLWIVWLIWTSTLPLPSYLTLSCIPLLLVYSAISWSVVASATIFLPLSWVYAQFSFTPPGYLWALMFAGVLLVKFASMHILIRSSLQFFVAVFLISVVFEMAQLVLITEMVNLSFWSFSNILSCFLSSAVQGGIGALLFQPLQKVMA